ncbi:hypothetical protein [Cellulomonas sp. Y8]|uniref:hypothetical protein n=1 Tax=Cellulomonas sp. Y8 TaxID=2591145 RepID=UPI0011C8494F|nr:hypothetical protein [Cellulomonas sp. Y8]
MSTSLTKAVVSVEVPPQARPNGHFYIHEAQLDGDENLAELDRIEILDEGGRYVAAVVEEITHDTFGPVYRVKLGS